MKLLDQEQNELLTLLNFYLKTCINCKLKREQKTAKKVDFVKNNEKGEEEGSKFSFRGTKIGKTNTGDPLFAFKCDKGETSSDKPVFLAFQFFEVTKLPLY